MASKIKCGCKPSKIDGTELKFGIVKNYKIPTKYSYINYLPEIENQGNTNMCVTYALSAHLDWNCNVDHKQNNKTNNHIDKKELYSIRTTPGDNGMTLKEALHYCKHSGVNSDFGKLKIDSYMMIGSELALKQALVLNGPCVAGIIVRSEFTDFWNGTENYGGHAVAIVGYDENGFIIRNSWGKSYGTRGYGLLEYEDFNKIFECWTIVD